MTFSADWLAMREPYDHRARDAGLVALLDERVGDGTITLCDLGCGLGSNLRYVAPRLRAVQRWILVDADPVLLAAVPDALCRWAHGRGETTVATADGLRIGARIEVALLEADLRHQEWPAVDVVTTQALLDLVSEAWLGRLATELVRRGTPLLAALTVDGRLRWSPPDPEDHRVHASFQAHQHTDRGFGPSPGPSAAARLSALLEAGGFTVESRTADWRIDGSDPAMLGEMVAGVAEAAAEMEPDPAPIHAWRDRRRELISGDAARLDVGHVDLLALPIDPR